MAGTPTPSADDVQLANEITSKLFDGFPDRPVETFLPRYEIYTADIEAAFGRLRYQFQYYAKALWPCLEAKISAPVPLDLGVLIGFHPRLIDPTRRYIASRLADWLKQQGLLIVTLSASDVTDCVRQNLAEFIARRASARQSDISASPGVEFEVSTQHHGSRVHYSPAYFLNMASVFGSPTSPVRAWIQPGRYIFGVQSPTDPGPVVDSGVYDIPPSDRAELMI